MRTEFTLKYRPKAWEDVIGQDAAVKSIKSIVRDKTSRAFVFTGPSGTGKTTIARLIAAELGCELKDLVEVDAATHTGVEHWRGIKENLRYSPLGKGQVKCIIVDEAHMLSKAAWNSLLKDVEEPPPFVWWFFCTTEAGKIPATIATRCSCYELRPVPKDDLFDLLVKIRDGEEGGPSDEILEMVARNAMGSPRDALSMLAQVWEAEGKKEAAIIIKSAAEDGDIINICRGLVKGQNWATLLPYVRELQGQNPEGLRIVVLEYMTKVALGTSEESRAGRVLEIMDAFATPYPNTPSLAPFLLSLAHALINE